MACYSDSGLHSIPQRAVLWIWCCVAGNRANRGWGSVESLVGRLHSCILGREPAAGDLLHSVTGGYCGGRRIRPLPDVRPTLRLVSEGRALHMRRLPEDHMLRRHDRMWRQLRSLQALHLPRLLEHTDKPLPGLPDVQQLHGILQVKTPPLSHLMSSLMGRVRNRRRACPPVSHLNGGQVTAALPPHKNAETGNATLATKRT
jgi:hypothetical protein